MYREHNGDGVFLMKIMLFGSLALLAIFLFSEPKTKSYSLLYTYMMSDIDNVTEGEVVSVRRVYIRGGIGVVRYRVAYLYYVNGIPYTGWIVSFRGMPTFEEVDRKYYPGKSVLVYYDSIKPEYAVLEPGALGGRMYGPIVVPVLFFLFGITMALRHLMRRLRC